MRIQAHLLALWGATTAFALPHPNSTDKDVSVASQKVAQGKYWQCDIVCESEYRGLWRDYAVSVYTRPGKQCAVVARNIRHMVIMKSSCEADDFEIYSEVSTQHLHSGEHQKCCLRDFFMGESLGFELMSTEGYTTGWPTIRGRICLRA